MRQIAEVRKSPGEKIVKNIKRATRRPSSSEEKIRIVLDELRGEDNGRMLNCVAVQGYLRAFTTNGLSIASWK